MLLAAGALAKTGQLNLAAAIALAVLAALLGHLAWYEAGRRGGVRVLRIFCKLSLEPDACVRRTQDLFAARGALTLLLAPWVPGLGGVAPPLAGIARMPLARFLSVDAAGSLLWAGTFVSVGYLFGDQLELILSVFLRLGGWFVLLVVSLLAGWLSYKLWDRRRLLRELDLTRISPLELKALLDAGTPLFIVDVRHPSELSTGTLPGALVLSADEVEARAAEVPRDRDIILYCS